MKKLLSDTSYVGISQFISSISILILQIYSVRKISLDQYGEYVAVQSFTTLLEAIFITRSGELALQFIGKYWISHDFFSARASAERIIRSDWILNWSIYLMMILAGFIFSNILKLNFSYILLLGMAIPAQIGYGVYKSIFISASKLKQQSIFEIITNLFYLINGIFGVYWLGVYGLILSLVSTAFFKTITASIITSRWLPPQSVLKELPSYKNAKIGIENEIWWKFNIHAILRNTFLNIVNQADILILNIYQNKSVVAIYKIAKTLSAIPVKAAAPIWYALRPRIMYSWHNKQISKLLKIILYPNIVMFICLIFCIIPIFVYSGSLIQLFYGHEYLSAKFPLAILIIGTWIFSAMTGWFNFFIIIGEEKLSGTLAYAFLAFTILLGGFIWGKLSMQYMSWVVSITMIMTSLLSWIILIKRIKNLIN